MQIRYKREGNKTVIIDPIEYQLPLLNTKYSEYSARAAPDAVAKVAYILRESDAFIFVSCEYSHSIPPALKNIINLYGPDEFGKKISWIVTYSSGSFGEVHAGFQLRSVASQIGCPSIPIQFPVSFV